MNYNDEWEDEENSPRNLGDETEICPTCLGRSFCLVCFGQGYYDDNPDDECEVCNGSGDCMDCEGVGEVNI